MFQCDTLPKCLRENLEKGLLFEGLCGAVMFFFEFLRKKRAIFARVFLENPQRSGFHVCLAGNVYLASLLNKFNCLLNKLRDSTSFFRCISSTDRATCSLSFV